MCEAQSPLTRIFSYNLYTNSLKWALLLSPGKLRLRAGKKLAKGTELSDCVRVTLRQPVSCPQIVTSSPPKCMGRAQERYIPENTPGLVFPLWQSSPVMVLEPKVIQEIPVQQILKPVFFPSYQQFPHLVQISKILLKSKSYVESPYIAELQVSALPLKPAGRSSVEAMHSPACLSLRAGGKHWSESPSPPGLQTHAGSRDVDVVKQGEK